MATTETPQCIVKGCKMTLGYYFGGGKYVCWLHALTVPGCLEAVKDQEEVALVAQ